MNYPGNAGELKDYPKEIILKDGTGVTIRTVREGDLLKVDIGVHVDGYIADSAKTVSLNSGKEDLIKASETALEEALKMMRPGVKVYEVSEVIEDTIRSMGFNPIINLTGHGLDKYELHARFEFPNVKNAIDYELKEGDVFAIEPFSTDGSGKVTETNKILIYRYLSDRPVRFPESRKILELTREKYHGLPFAKRWLLKEIKISPIKLNLIFQLERGFIHFKRYIIPLLEELKINKDFLWRDLNV